MKKLWIFVICLVLCGCTKGKNTGSGGKVPSSKTEASVVTTSWFDTYKKIDSDMTLEITETKDLENAMAFKFSDGKHSFEDYVILDSKDDHKAVCDLGEDGIVITFTKTNDGIDVSVGGQFFYLDDDITGSFRR